MNDHKVILVIEDNMADFIAMKRVFKQYKLANPIKHIDDGDEALDYLFKRNGHNHQPHPHLILLDLNLPGTDGREILTAIKSEPVLKSIPVIVLTTSADEIDIKSCYEAGANSYVQKPVTFDGLMYSISLLMDYWLELSILPKTKN